MNRDNKEERTWASDSLSRDLFYSKKKKNILILALLLSLNKGYLVIKRSTNAFEVLIHPCFTSGLKGVLVLTTTRYSHFPYSTRRTRVKPLVISLNFLIRIAGEGGGGDIWSKRTGVSYRRPLIERHTTSFLHALCRSPGCRVPLSNCCKYFLPCKERWI